MKPQSNEAIKAKHRQEGIPVNLASDYIADMLSELCMVAAQSGQEDLYGLLKITSQMARDFQD